MRTRRIQGLVGGTIIAGALAFAAAPAHAWTYQDCVDVNFDHPDCVQYQTTTTTEAPTSTTTSTIANSTTSSTIPTSPTTVAATTTSTAPPPPSTAPSTTSTIQIGTAATITAPPAELPHTGSSSLPLGIAGFLALIVGAGSIAYARRPKVRA